MSENLESLAQQERTNRPRSEGHRHGSTPLGSNQTPGECRDLQRPPPAPTSSSLSKSVPLEMPAEAQ